MPAIEWGITVLESQRSSESESECKCLTCNIKNQLEVSLVYCTNQTKTLMETKLKRKPLSSPVSVKAVRWKGWGLWREGFKEKFRVQKSRNDGQ